MKGVPGAAVRAIAPGFLKVYRAACGYGQLVAVVEHDLGTAITFTNSLGQPVSTRYLLSIYGHIRRTSNTGIDTGLSEAVPEMSVQEGQVIGYVNDSSDADGPYCPDAGYQNDPNGDGYEHLHLGIRLSSAAVAAQNDPGAWFRGYINNCPNNCAADFAKGSEVIPLLMQRQSRFVTGDWNGDGIDAEWTFSGGQWTIPASDAGGTQVQFTMGLPGDLPLVGDWNGDGRDDPGIFRASQNPSTFYLDINHDAGADWVIPLSGGYPQDIPVAGDWDGDGDDDIGAWDSNTRIFYLFRITSPSTFADHASFQMGNPGDMPIAGNWDGLGPTEVGVFRPGDPNANTNNFYFRKSDGTVVSLTALPVGMSNGWGNVGDAPLVGDWNNDGYDTIGLYRPSTQETFLNNDLPKFSGGQYTLTVTKTGTGSGTVTSNPAGISCGSDCSESYNSGTVVNLTPTAASGSTFAGWTGDPDCADASVTMTASKTCTATFAAACSSHFICEDFAATASGWTLNGSTSQKLTEGVLELTPALNWQVGSAFYSTAAPIDTFTANFQMRLDSGSSPVADGLTFAVVAAGPATLGDWGRCLGYCGTPGRSIAIEFDTYQSVEYADPALLHVGLDVDGNLTSVAKATLNPIVNQGLLTVRVVFYKGTVDVYLQGDSSYVTETKVLTAAIPNWTPFSGYFGFTAATGGYNERHVIDNVTVDLAPGVTTEPASGITQTSATLNGTVNPNGSATVYFEFGPTTSYGSTTVGYSISGTSAQATSGTASPLTCNTLYHFRAVGQNAGGVAKGLDTTFTTSACPAEPRIVTISINDVSATEGNSGTTTAVFTVTLSAAFGQVVSVNFDTNDGTASGSTDFTPNSGSLTFNPGDMTANVSVSIKGDTTPEPDETFTVVLSAPLNATLAKATGTGTIGDDDDGVAGPRISIDDRAVSEGSAVNAGFRVTLSAPSSQTVTVNYTTANGTATAPSDYTTTSGTLSFSAGRTSHSIFVPIVTDTTAEGNESFFVNLSSPTNATITRGQATGTIGDPPTVVHSAMYRAYNVKTDYHFFTTDLSSKNFAVSVLGFRDESTPVPFYVWNAGQTGTVPLFRMYNPNLGRHFYTAGVGSRDFLMGIGAVFEKEEGFVYPLGTSPAPSGATELFLLYNNNSGTHLFTADAGQKNAILNLFPGVWVAHTSVGLVFTSP